MTNTKNNNRDSSSISNISKNNTSQLTINDYYNKFLERYLKDLQDSGTTDANHRKDIYIADIIRKVAFQLANLNISNNMMLNETMINKIYKLNGETYTINKPIELTSEKFIKEQIQYSINTMSNNIDDSKIPDKTTYMLFHNGPTIRIRKVPKNCIIVVLTPLNRLGIVGLNDWNYMTELLKPENNFFYDFMLNPVCYQKNILNSFFYNANVYFPGQTYYDIFIEQKETDNFTYGIITSYTGDDKKLVDEFYTFEKGKQVTFYLSEILEKCKLSGIIIIHGCRNLNAKNISIDEGTTMYRYEHFLNILNETVTNYNDVNYEKCNTIISASEINFNKSKKLKRNNNNKLNPTKINRGIGVSARLTKKSKNICDNIIKYFLKIDTENDKTLNKQYIDAWNFYEECKTRFNKTNDELIDEISNNKVNMNVFFSCVVRNINEYQKIYEILINKKITIDSLYFNGINLDSQKNTILNNLLYFINKNNNLSQNLLSIDLRNTNLKFKNNENKFTLNNLYLSDKCTSLKQIRLENNNITPNDINDFIDNNCTITDSTGNKVFYNNINQDLIQNLLNLNRINTITSQDIIDYNTQTKTEQQQQPEQQQQEQQQQPEQKQPEPVKPTELEQLPKPEPVKPTELEQLQKPEPEQLQKPEPVKPTELEQLPEPEQLPELPSPKKRKIKTKRSKLFKFMKKLITRKKYKKNK
jgi:hypothetical protein